LKYRVTRSGKATIGTLAGTGGIIKIRSIAIILWIRKGAVDINNIAKDLENLLLSVNILVITYKSNE